jgi:hypothetical protein
VLNFSGYCWLMHGMDALHSAALCGLQATKQVHSTCRSCMPVQPTSLIFTAHGYHVRRSVMP